MPEVITILLWITVFVGQLSYSPGCNWLVGQVAITYTARFNTHSFQIEFESVQVKFNMSSLQELKDMGIELGYEGKELQQFVFDQQSKEREERHAEREAMLKKQELMNRLEQDKLEFANKLEMERIALEREKEQREREKEQHERFITEKELEHKFKLDEMVAQPAAASGDANISSSYHGLKLPPFEEGKDSMDAYLQRFERYATARKWRSEEWATNLSALLRGKALEVYSRLSPAQSLDYDILKQGLLKRFEMTEEGFKKRFRSCRPESGETFSQFVLRLENYFDRWRELSGTPADYGSLVDFILRDQMLQSCNRELTLFLKERIPKDINDMATLADQFCEARGTSASSQAGTRLTTFGPKPQRATQQTSAPVPHKVPSTQSNTSGKSGKRCFSCGEMGHLSFECLPRRSTPKKASAVVEQETLKKVVSDEPLSEASCSECGRDGNPRPAFTRRGRGRGRGKPSSCAVVTQTTNTSTDSMSSKQFETQLSSACNEVLFDFGVPTSRGRIGMKEVTVMRDTGCAGVVVKRSLVNDDQLLGKTQTCIMADGTQVMAPVALIHIDTPYFSGETEAWCMERPVFDLILGNIEGVRAPNDPDANWRLAMPVQTRAQAKRQQQCQPGLKVPEALKDSATPEEIKQAQTDDLSLKRLRELAELGEEKDTKFGRVRYFYNKGFLFREFQSSRQDGGQVFSQLVVPAPYRETVMRLAHESILSGHTAARRTTQRVLADFFWPGVKADVRRYCRSCDVCQRTFPKGRVTKSPLGQMPIIDVPFQRIAVDLIGPLHPVTDRGNRYVLTVVDYATRYPEATALSTIDTERVAEALVDIFSRVGVPREMLTDMGTQFTSDLMKEVSRLLSMRRLTTTPYHPMCNGLVEKFNGTLKAMLRRMCADRPRDWDKYLSALLFAYREVPQESLGFAPFELLYGRTVRGPMSILKELWSGETTDPDVKTTYQYVLELRDKLETTCQLAQEELKKASARHRRYYNKKAKSCDLQAGDKALVLLPTDHNKLLMQWKGPFSVVRKVGQLDYQLDMNGKIRLFHGNMLRKYTERETTAVIQQPPEGSLVGVAVIEDIEDEGGEILSTPSASASESVKDVHIAESLDDTQRKEIQKLVGEFQDVLTDVPGKTNLEQHTVKTTTEEPVRVKQYPLPFSVMETVSDEVNKMLQSGVIEPSESPYASPVVIVKKKDGSSRFCIDFRQLNKVTVFDAEPMTNVDDVLSKLAGYRYYSKLDLSKGYWQIPMEENSRKKTAFTTPQGLFQFRVMPFGLVNAPATFNRMMRKLLDDLDGVDNFVDDIMVFTATWEEQLQVLRELLTRLRRAALTARPSKCYVGYRSLECLGHVVGEERVRPHPDKVKALLEAERPRTKKQVRSFLGLAGFYRKFVPNYAAIAAPLSDLTKKGCPNNVQWGESQERAFNTLKKMLTSEPVLKLPVKTERYLLQTDASERGIGAVLLQMEGDQKLPVVYLSRKLSPRETAYSTVEKECLAIVWSVQKLQRYLYGVDFDLETDHQPLAYLQSKKVTNARLMRWALALQPYRFRIVAIKGSSNVLADYLSRS